MTESQRSLDTHTAPATVFFGTAVRYGLQWWLFIWSATPQSEAADARMIEVDFAAHQAMQPVWTYGETLAKEIDVSALIAAANEDDMAM